MDAVDEEDGSGEGKVEGKKREVGEDSLLDLISGATEWKPMEKVQALEEEVDEIRTRLIKGADGKLIKVALKDGVKGKAEKKEERRKNA